MPTQTSNSVSNLIDATHPDEHARTYKGIVPRQREALEGRAIQAALIFVGFYMLALLTVALLLLTPFLLIDTLGMFSPYLILSSYGLAILIVVAIVPRPDRFTPPGPRLDASTQPKLFSLISDVAERTGEEVPSEVYLTTGVNAFVTQRGGILGVGSRRVMGVGLGILQVLNVSEFKFVLAHEFGHYYDGHLKLGPWIYHSRMAMIRTVQSLGEWNSSLYGPYLHYALFFLRRTQKISRAQEFVADELAARQYGAQTAIHALRRVHAGSQLFNSHWEDEIAPRLRAGYRPQILESFAHLVRHKLIATESLKSLNSAVRGTDKNSASAYNSHPPLAERIRALDDLVAGDESHDIDTGDDTPAIFLLDNAGNLDALLLEHIYGQRRARALKPITWEPLDRRMTLVDYEELVRQHSRELKGMTPLSLYQLSGKMERFSNKLVPTPKFVLESDQYFVTHLATETLGGAIMLALRQVGWQVQFSSGEEIVCTRGEETFKPFRVVQHLSTGRLNSHELERHCIEAGIAEIDLGSVAK